MTTLLGLVFGCGIAASQTPRAEQTMNSKRQYIAEVAALTSMGHLDQLRTVLIGGLNSGITVSELKEVMVHSYAYCGFPRALRGLQTLVAVLDERKAKGIRDNQGREASPITDTRSKYEGVEPMLKGHMGIALNVGVTPDELRGVLAIIEKNIGRSEADNGKQVLNELLQSKGLTTKPETPIVAVENDVKKQKVTFHNRFLIDIVGDLYFPADYDATKKYAAIIVGHPFGGVKEQTSGLHARKLAELGYVALAFDASYYGESGGYPRRMESPEVRVEDFSAAVDFLTNHPAVYADKIGVIGICGGGCYSVSATQIDHRIKALATISMYDMGRARRQGVGDSQTYEQRMAILDEIGRQRTMEYGGAVRKDIRALPEKVDENTPKFAIDFLDYYDNPQRGQHPNSTGYYSYTSLAPMMNFFPFAQIETISPRPMLFIVGENAVSKYFSEDAYAKAAEPKELFVVPGATHVDLYDQPKYLKITLPKLDSFFKQHLK